MSNQVPSYDFRHPQLTTDERLVDINQKYGMAQRRVPYWIEKAEKFGYVFKGWTMMNYLKNTHIPAPGEYEYEKGIPKEGFENIITWGRQGTRKSNLNRQMMFGFLKGGEDEGRQSQEIWRNVLDYLLMTKQQIYDIYHMTTDEQIKVPYVTLDDITTTIPKQLFFVGMQEFIRFQQFIATIRMRIGVVGSNSPLPQNVISVLRDNISMEVICFPIGSYMTERYCWFPDEYKPAAAYLKKVLIEYRTWDFLAEPEWVYKEYKKRRWVITEEIVKKLQGDDSEPEYIIPQVDMKEFEKAVRLCTVCKCQSPRQGICVCEKHVHDAVQLSNAKLRDVVARVTATLKDKATTIRADSLKDIQEVFGATPETVVTSDEH